VSRLYEALRRAELAREEDDKPSDAHETAYPLSDYPREGNRIGRSTPPEAIRAADVELRTSDAVPLDSPSEHAPAVPHEAAGGDVCPYCAAPFNVHDSSRWLRWVFRLSRTPPFHCRSCRRRFSTPKSRSTLGPIQPRTVPGFLPPEDGRRFSDLIQDMARDERERS